MLFVKSDVISITFLCQVCNKNSHITHEHHCLLYENTFVVLEGSSSSRVTLVAGSLWYTKHSEQVYIQQYEKIDSAFPGYLPTLFISISEPLLNMKSMTEIPIEFHFSAEALP